MSALGACVGRLASKQQAMLGITMPGTAPIFYRVVVTEKLFKALKTRFYPDDQAVALRAKLPVPEIGDYLTA